MSSTDPASQATNHPMSEPPAQPTVIPASPQAETRSAGPTNPRPAGPPRRLVRRTGDKMLGGVCSGLADHLGLDPTLVRLATVVATVLGLGSVIIVYLVAWVIVPKDVDVDLVGDVVADMDRAAAPQTASVWSG